MKKYTKYIIFAIIVIIIVAILATMVITKNNKEKNQENKEDYETYNGIEIDQNQTSYQENTTINDMKEEIGATGDSSIYELQSEYDGRKILAIKPNIQFSTVLTGIIEDKKPEDNLAHIEEIGATFVGKKGMWIAPNSRETFLDILQKTTQNNYTINKDGYLEYTKNQNANETDKALEEILSSDKMYIISTTGLCYILDEVSGKVTEYPFEKMAPDQPCEYYESENQKIIILTTNKEKILTEKELIDAIIYN